MADDELRERSSSDDEVSPPSTDLSTSSLGRKFLGLDDPKLKDLDEEIAAALSLRSHEYVLSSEKYKDLTRDLPSFKVFDWTPHEVSPHLLRPEQRSAATELFWSQKRLLEITRYLVASINDLLLIKRNHDYWNDDLDNILKSSSNQLLLCLNAIQTERDRLRALVRENILPTPKMRDSRESSPAISADEMEDLVLEAKRSLQVQNLMDQRRRRLPNRSGRRGQRRSRRGFSSSSTPSTTKSDKASQKSRGGESA